MFRFHLILIAALSRNTMELFEFLREFYQKMGFISSRPAHRIYAFNWKTLLLLLAPTYFCISTFLFMLFQANSLQDHTKFMDLSYWTASSFQSVLIFVITILKMPNIIKVIKKFEEIIQKSEWNRKMNRFSVFWLVFFFSFRSSILQ